MFMFEFEKEKGLPERWIQKAIKRPGRVREFVRNMFGEKAFDEKGKIKMEYLYKALEIAKGLGDRSLYSAILLAIRLKRMGQKRKMRL